MNAKGLNFLMSLACETRFLVQNESCKCKCRLNENIFKSKQKWNHLKCWCECKELDDCSFGKVYVWKTTFVWKA